MNYANYCMMYGWNSYLNKRLAIQTLHCTTVQSLQSLQGKGPPACNC